MTVGEQLEPTLIMCIEAFANSMLVPQGHVTFQEVYAAFKSHFPLVRRGRACHAHSRISCAANRMCEPLSS